MDLFVITNGISYLTLTSSNSVTTTHKISLAQKYTEEKAKNVIKNLPKTYKNIGFRAEKVPERKVEIPATKSPETSPQIRIASTKNANRLLTEKESILAKVSEFENFMAEMCKGRKELDKALSQVEAEIQDILHAIEFYTLNAAEGYKLYKLLHDKRIERRKIKDFIEIVGYLEETSGEGFSKLVGTKSILGKDNRKYKPRVLKNLFERGE